MNHCTNVPDPTQSPWNLQLKTYNDDNRLVGALRDLLPANKELCNFNIEDGPATYPENVTFIR